MEAMNRLAEALAQVCREHLLAEKWLIAPSLRVGYQWLDAVAFAKQPVVNARVNTLKGLVLDLAAPVLAERKLTLASVRCGAMIVDKIISRLQQDGHPFFARLIPGTGIAQAFHACIDSIRLAGLSGADLAARHFEDPERGQALQTVLDDYLQQLHVSGLIDYAELIQIAITRLETATDALPADALLLVPQDGAFGKLEERLLAAILGKFFEIPCAPKPDWDLPEQAGQSAKAHVFLVCIDLQQPIPEHLPEQRLGVIVGDPLNPHQQRPAWARITGGDAFGESDGQLPAVITIANHRHHRLVDERDVRVDVSVKDFHVIQPDIGSQAMSENVPNLVHLSDRLDDLDGFPRSGRRGATWLKKPAQEVGVCFRGRSM